MITVYDKIIGKTKNLEVRALKTSDFEIWKKGFADQLPSRNKFDEGWFDTDFLTEEWYENKLKERADMAQKDYCYLLNVFRIEDGVSLGYCDITTHMREDFQYARIGYTIFNNYWGMGYGGELVKALIEIGFNDLNFHRLEAHINIDNEASKRTALKGGMEYECTRKAFIYEDGQWTDNEIYFIVNKHWEKEE